MITLFLVWETEQTLPVIVFFIWRMTQLLPLIFIGLLQMDLALMQLEKRLTLGHRPYILQIRNTLSTPPILQEHQLQLQL